MNIEQRFQQISQSNYEALDGDSFLAKLHGERQKRHMKKMGFINGITAAVIVAVFGFVKRKKKAQRQTHLPVPGKKTSEGCCPDGI